MRLCVFTLILVLAVTHAQRRALSRHKRASDTTVPPCGAKLQSNATCCGQYWLVTRLTIFGYTQTYEYRYDQRYTTGKCCQVTIGQCYCDPVLAPECIIATTTVQTTVTTPTTTTTLPTTTTTLPTTTTALPTTTTTLSTTTTTLSTTTPTPSTTSTTTALPKVCPAPIQGRLLGSTPLSGCDPGVVGFWIGSNFIVCNGVYATDPKTLAPVVMTLDTCYQSVTGVTLAQIPVDIKLNGSAPLGYQSYLFKSVSSVSGVTRLENSQVLTGYFNPTGGVCVSPACVYNNATMVVNTSSCYIASYGANQPLSINTASDNGAVNVVTVQQASSGCPNLQANTDQKCFVSTNGGANCRGDAGAPVYCKIQTGETVLYGLNVGTPQCGSTGTYFSVEPIPSF